MKDDSRNGKWYLVQCKPRESFRAEQHLTQQSYICFHPTHPIKRKTSSGLKQVIVPYFPYYLFIYLSYQDKWSKIRSTRGVSRLVHYDGIPASLDEEIIEALKVHCAKLHGIGPKPLYNVGDRVIVTEGSFKAVEGIVMSTNDEERVMLLLNLLNRQHCLEFPIKAVALA